MRLLLVIGLCAACTDNTVIVRPVIDIPINDTAQATALDSLTLSVAHAGAVEDIQSAEFSHGEEIELPNVSFGDDLVIHMSGRIGSSQNFAYGRTCQFSVRADARPPTPHLFFARTVKFGHMSQQPLPRLGGLAMTYRDGAGLIIGGVFPDEQEIPQALTQIERFDPNSGAYDVLHEIERRIDAAVAIVGLGPFSRIVIVGGIDPQTNLGADFIEVIEAERNTDRQYMKLFEPTIARTQMTATTLSDGRVVVIGGLIPENPQTMSPATASGLVSDISVETGAPAVKVLRDAVLAFPRYGHSATRLTDELGAAVLVAGGRDNVGDPVKRAELFKPLAADGRGDFSDQFMADMIVPRWQHQAVRLPDGSVLFIGGLTKNPVTGVTEVVDQMELFSPLDGRFLPVGLLSEEAPTAGRVGMSATVLPDGRVLLAGGQLDVGCAGPEAPACAPIDSAFIARLDPQDGTVDILATDRLAVPRSGHQATLLCDGTVLISGGVGVVGAAYERYNPVIDGRR